MSETLELTPEMLQTLISTAVTAAVAEAKKPAPPTEAELAKEEQDRKDRADMAKSVWEQKQRERDFQKVCTHEHPAREQMLGKTHCVHVKEENPTSPGYILCQRCQARIRPESFPRNIDPNAHYDTALFNRLFQDCAVDSII